MKSRSSGQNLSLLLLLLSCCASTAVAAVAGGGSSWEDGASVHRDKVGSRGVLPWESGVVCDPGVRSWDRSCSRGI